MSGKLSQEEINNLTEIEKDIYDFMHEHFDVFKVEPATYYSSFKIRLKPKGEYPYISYFNYQNNYPRDLHIVTKEKEKIFNKINYFHKEIKEKILETFKEHRIEVEVKKKSFNPSWEEVLTWAKKNLVHWREHQDEFVQNIRKTKNLNWNIFQTKKTGLYFWTKNAEWEKVHSFEEALERVKSDWPEMVKEEKQSAIQEKYSGTWNEKEKVETVFVNGQEYVLKSTSDKWKKRYEDIKKDVDSFLQKFC